jgi:hypothetical protein
VAILACSEHLDAGYVDQPPLIASLPDRAPSSGNRLSGCVSCPPGRRSHGLAQENWRATSGVELRPGLGAGCFAVPVFS